MNPFPNQARMLRSPIRLSMNVMNWFRTMAWLVGTGLGAVAFAEPRRSCPFRDVASPSRHGALHPSPTQNPACRFPAPGSPGRTYDQDASDSRMTSLRVPAARTTSDSGGSTSTAGDAGCVCAALESTAAEPRVGCRRVSVYSDESEVPRRSHAACRRVTLLVPSLPVPMLREPLLGARQKLATALPARETNHRKRAAAVGFHIRA